MKYVSFSLALIFTIMVQSAIARDIFVSTKGNDSNPGTQNQPMASLAGARDLIRQLKAGGNSDGFRIVVANGTYFMLEPLILGPEDSGTEAEPLVITSELNARPLFIGGKQIKNWEKTSGKAWKAQIPEASRYGFYFEQLYVNGKFATRAKTPNQGYFIPKNVEETVIDQGSGRYPRFATQKLTVDQPVIDELMKIGEPAIDDALLTFYHKWDNTRKRIVAFDEGNSALFMSGPGMKSWNPLDKQTRFYIENYEAALDTCGEWFLSRDKYLYYIPHPDETIENTSIYAPVTNHFIVFKGKSNEQKVSHIKIENLNFAVSGYRAPAGGNEPAQAAAPIEASILADFASHIEIVGCEISQTGTNAIWFRKACNNCQVSRSYMHDLGAGGIKIGSIQIPQNEQELTNHIVIDNNIIRDGGFVFPCAVGLTIFQASDNRVTHNEIAHFFYSGVSVGWVWGYTHSPTKRNIIEFNHIHHLGRGQLCDMGGVYCLGQSEGTSVSNNHIHHVYSFNYGGWGLYTDEGSTGILMENNLVYSCKDSGFHQHYGKENTIRNNIFAANIKAQLQATRVENHLSFTFTNNIVWFGSGNLLASSWDKINLQTDNNCYWNTLTKSPLFGKMSFSDWQATGKDRNSIIADPGFVNPQAFDFRIKNKATVKRIGFQIFDYTKAGVYGSDEWVKLAKNDASLTAQYDEAVKQLESRK